MRKITRLDKAIPLIQKLKRQNKRIILTGGVFDIFHYGHVRFLEKAKKQGDTLIVALEPDKKVKELKGEGRPINNEQVRARVLAALSCVDYVIILPELVTDNDYQKLTEKLQPDVIAITKGDPKIIEKRQQAKQVGGKLIVVTTKIPTPSSTKLMKLLALE